MGNFQEDYQKKREQKEKVGLELETVTSIYYTDEAPEHGNESENRFEYGEFSAQLRASRGYSTVRPRFFRETTTTIVNREELSEEQWLSEQSLTLQELYKKAKSNAG